VGNNQDSVTVRGLVSGKVQGVSFRYFVSRAAAASGVTGYAKNLADGRVEVLLTGTPDMVWEVRKQVLKGPLISRVDGCEWEEVETAEYPGFDIL
jgi:acylphosphatase